LIAATPAFAKDLRDYCPERPGLDTPPCIVDAGHVSVETALVDWTLERDGQSRTDTVLIGDTLVRVGLTDAIEAQIGWTPYGHVRARDRTTGAIDRTGRAGDVTLGFKASLMNPAGDGTSIAIDPFVTLPVGRVPVGAGDWGAGVRLPIGLSLNDALSLSLTPEIDAAVDEDGNGRHAAYGSAAGINLKFSEKLGGSAELAAFRDDDPSGHSTQTFGALSLGWQPIDDLQLDIGATAGLNTKSPDVELYAGVSRRF
jgi:hypothetical protein